MNMQDMEPIEIKVRDRASMDRCISAAVDQMIESAKRQRTHGILVTRLGDGHFVVGLSNSVPFGYTGQLDSRRQTAGPTAALFPHLHPVGPKRYPGDTPFGANPTR